jgi:hypothetical protein
MIDWGCSSLAGSTLPFQGSIVFPVAGHGQLASCALVHVVGEWSLVGGPALKNTPTDVSKFPASVLAV